MRLEEFDSWEKGVQLTSVQVMRDRGESVIAIRLRYNVTSLNTSANNVTLPA